MVLGLDFEVFAVLTNNCMETKTCNVLFFAVAVGYNGKLGDSCGFTSDKMEVPPGEGTFRAQLTSLSLSASSQTILPIPIQCKLSLPVNKNRLMLFLFFPLHQKFVCPSDWNINITAR